MGLEEARAKARKLLAENPHWGEKRLAKAVKGLSKWSARQLVKELNPDRPPGTYQKDSSKPSKIEVTERKKTSAQLIEDLQKNKKGIKVESLELYQTGALVEVERAGYFVEYHSGLMRLCTNPDKHITSEAISGLFDPTREWHKFLVITDTHFGGDQAQPAFVIAMLQEAARRKYSAVLHLGDIVDGHPKMHAGFEYELKLTRSDDQVDFSAWVMNHSELQVWGIGGNHCNSFFKSGGLNVCRQIAERSNAYNYIGPIQGWVAGPNGDPNFIRLFHPGDGCSYALSYKDQKASEYLVLENDKVPTGFHFTGHYHKYNQMRGPNGARYFLAPASCATTSFMKAKKLINQAGALFIEFTLDAQGRVDRCLIEDVPLWPSQWTKCDYSNMGEIRKQVNRLKLPPSAWHA